MAKILLVDDDPLLTRMYQTKFNSEGHVVENASDGVKALEMVGQVKPDLILLDVMMPRMNGLEVLTKLKANPATKSIPVVMLTNVSASEADEEKGLELGAVAYLVKANYTPKEVVAKVKEILGGYKREIPEVKTQVKQ